LQGDLSEEQAALVALETLGGRKEQGIVTSKEAIHADIPEGTRRGTVDRQLVPSRHGIETGPRVNFLLPLA